MSAEVRVEPGVLDAMAQIAGDLRAALDKDLTDVERETTQAARDLTDWLTGRSVEALM